ncbi:hypothetical protein [Lactococcus sp. NH2-7C]|uniref:hypothetical protein n=1 Tax=Lactococcus sp. NH2-7C TaxID=2879149 RepID=UPI001CDC7B98|nr:hypothetical protein [Lactococcus sp. NH2-7C]MCA2390582.1 hypothetical protein [Lactococcus sp. NH2-7C]WGV29792.1 hypothetical protein QJV49_09685 [Lactococcus sp. NH2-7C]
MVEKFIDGNVMKVVSEFQEAMAPFNKGEQALLMQREESKKIEELPIEERFSIDNIRKRKNDSLDVESIDKELSELHAEQRKAIADFDLQHKLNKAQNQDRDNLKPIEELGNDVDTLTDKFIQDVMAVLEKRHALQTEYQGNLQTALGKIKVEFGKAGAEWDTSLNHIFSYTFTFREKADVIKRKVREEIK